MTAALKFDRFQKKLFFLFSSFVWREGGLFPSPCSGGGELSSKDPLQIPAEKGWRGGGRMRRFKLLFSFDACGGMISLPKKMSDEEDLKRHSVSPFKKKREKVSKKKAKKEKFCRIGKKSQGPFSAFFLFVAFL